MKTEFFGIVDFISFIGWLVIFIIVAQIILIQNKEKSAYKYFLPHFYWKTTLSVAFALTYTLYYNGGDTTAYHQGAVTLNRLFFESPVDYLQEIISTPSRTNIPSYFNHATGRPPEWIYPEANSWVVCKIASFFSFFSFGSYLTLNLFFGVISTWISWKFFIFLDNNTRIKTRYLALACLFIPSVGFWCSGLMKDTIVMCAILLSIMSFFKLFKRNYIHFYRTLFTFVLANYFLFITRPFVLIGIFIPFFILIILRLNKDKPVLVRFLTRTVGILFALVCLIVYLRSSELGEFSSDQILDTAKVIHSDFKVNERYTGKRYDLGLNDFSPTSLVLAIPGAIVATLYRPFLWEFEGPLMFIIGIESLFFIYFTVRFFLVNRRVASLSILYKKELLLFALLFILIFGYFVGFTSGLFGVLARLKAPALPFFLLLLFSRDQKEELKDIDDEKLIT